MRILFFVTPRSETDPRPERHYYTREGAIREWRENHPNHEYTDEEALMEFIIMNWAVWVEVKE